MNTWSKNNIKSRSSLAHQPTSKTLISDQRQIFSTSGNGSKSSKTKDLDPRQQFDIGDKCFQPVRNLAKPSRRKCVFNLVPRRSYIVYITDVRTFIHKHNFKCKWISTILFYLSHSYSYGKLHNNENAMMVNFLYSALDSVACDINFYYL